MWLGRPIAPLKLTLLRLCSNSTIVCFSRSTCRSTQSSHGLRNSVISSQLVGVAGFTVLIYDHLITFADEVRVPPFRLHPSVEIVSQVQYIWRKLRGPRKPLLANHFGPYTHLRLKVVYFFLLVSISRIFYSPVYD